MQKERKFGEKTAKLVLSNDSGEHGYEELYETEDGEWFLLYEDGNYITLTKKEAKQRFENVGFTPTK